MYKLRAFTAFAVLKIFYKFFAVLEICAVSRNLNKIMIAVYIDRHILIVIDYLRFSYCANL
jgi:hypothetical protein